MKHTEDSLQARCFQRFHNQHYPRAIMSSVPNGGTRNKVEAAKLKATGLTAGIPDVFIILPKGNVAWIEFKALNGVLSPKQKIIHEHMATLGHEVYVVRSDAEFDAVVEKILHC